VLGINGQKDYVISGVWDVNARLPLHRSDSPWFEILSEGSVH
jgi:hypothetical protein